MTSSAMPGSADSLDLISAEVSETSTTYSTTSSEAGSEDSAEASADSAEEGPRDLSRGFTGEGTYV